MVSEIGAAPCLANASSCLLKPFQRLFYLRHHARSAAYGPGDRREPAPSAAVCKPRHPARPARARLRVGLPPRHMGQGLGGAALRPRGPHPGPRLAPMGVLGSGRALCPCPPCGPAVARPRGEHTGHRYGVDHPGPSMRPGGLGPVPTGGSVRSRPLAPECRERSRGAGGLTGSPGAPPGDRALP